MGNRPASFAGQLKAERLQMKRYKAVGRKAAEHEGKGGGKVTEEESRLYEKAVRLAASAHKGQVDKGGTDYIRHPLAARRTAFS